MKIDNLARKNTRSKPARSKSARSKSGREKLDRENFDDFMTCLISLGKISKFKNS